MPPKKKVVAKKAAVTEEKVNSEGSTGANTLNKEAKPTGTKRDVPAKKRTRPNDVESKEPVKKKGKLGKEPEVTDEKANEKLKEPLKKKGGKQKKEQEIHEDNENGTPSEPPQKRGRQKKEPEVKDEIENGEPSEPPQKRRRQKKEPEVKEDIENGESSEPPQKRGRQKKALEETENVEADKRKKKSNKEAEKIDKTGRNAKKDNLEGGLKDPANKRGKQNKEPEKEKEEKKKQVKTGTKKQSEEITDDKNKVKKQTSKKTEKMKTTKESSDDSSKPTKWNEINFDCSNTNMAGEAYNFKITSWNVDGMRAWLRKDGMKILDHLSPDILCLQETKCTSSQVPDIADIEGYENYWCSSKKNGYAGVVVLSKEKPISVTYGIRNEEQDEDGRCITAEFEKFFLVTVYVPNAGRKLVTLDKRLKWNDIFKDFIKDLDKRKPVIICGDMNVAHSEIDLTNPKTNTKNAGFTQEERDGLTNFLNEGYVDTFRVLYPEKKDSYTYWTYMNNARERNIGWRLDYFIVSQRFQKNICDNVIHDKVFGSDHCPLTLFMNV